MGKEEIFNRIVEEAKKEIIDPVIWLLYFQFDIVDGITHEEYVRAIAEKYKNVPTILKNLQPYFTVVSNRIK
ncbi:hypothetical protein [Priestia megaterium]|uniref:hypothetical protein n=1 Tax=Priestia megaterium TaxID=1404 RepID=UPI00207A97FC|nr:hypothetical protein [Priestia megaterium]USL25098.1 hypothetical protein LIT33_02295 [Priestia megaterium]